jgi:hypothetical protein
LPVDFLNIFVGPLIVGAIVGFIIWKLGQRAIERSTRNEAIRDLMTYRGDYSSDLFRRSLNKVSITFHDNEETRKQIRDLNESINNSDSRSSTINRKIVGLIYDLCRKNGFKGITEYDIDQSFPEQKQIPIAAGSIEASSIMPEPIKPATDNNSKKNTQKPKKS